MIDNEKILKGDNSKQYSLEELTSFFGKYPTNEFNVYNASTLIDDWRYYCNNRFKAACIFFDIQLVRQVGDIYYCVFNIQEGGTYYVFWKDYYKDNNPLPVHSMYISYLKEINAFDELIPGTNTAVDVAAISSAVEIRFINYGNTESYTLLKNGNFLKITYEDCDEIKSREDLVIKKIEEIDKQGCSIESYLKAIYEMDLP